MQYRALPVVKANSESPLLPLNQTFICDLEARSIRLGHIQLLQIRPQPIGKQLRHVFGRFVVSHDILSSGAIGETIFTSTGSKLVDADDLLGSRVHDRDQGKWVGVEVCVWVLGASVRCEDQSLKVATVFFVCIWAWGNSSAIFKAVEKRSYLHKAMAQQ